MSKQLTLLAVYFLVTLISGCSATMIDNDSPPEAQYAEGERLLEKDRILEAVERFRILKSRYPYSKYAALASVRIGDAHFKDEAYMEAAAAYKIFRELYPKHEQAGYALHKIGESYYNLMPSTTDRDLEPAESAIEAYQQLLKEYPGSAQRKEAEQRIRELRGKLAEKEAYVGDFYFKRELYQAAAGRYSLLVDKYADFDYGEKALYRLAYSYERMGEYEKAERTLNALDRQFPNDASDRRNLRAKISKGKGTKAE